MQFLMSVITDSLDMATEEEMTAITAFNLRLRENNALVFAGGPAGPQESWLLDNRNGRGAIANQPLVEHSEFIIGLWIVESSDMESAQQLASEASRACNRKIELRQFL